MSYRIQELIGEGAFGQVYKAYFRNAGKDCALKTFHDRYLGNKTTRDRFRKEVDIWVGLERHPNIVPAYLVEEMHGRLFVVMEYVEPDGRNVAVDGADRVSLYRCLKGSPLDIERVIEWGIQFCRGMEHANRQGIRAHLDIKPQNILIGGDGRLRITDFGVAVTVSRSNQSVVELPPASSQGSAGHDQTRRKPQGLYGTPGYMAPEVYDDGSAAADVRSDIYSFGLVLWQMTTGSYHPPFHVADEHDPWEYARRVHELQIHNRPPRIETPIWATIDRALRRDPSDRHSDFTELCEELQQVALRLMGHCVAEQPQPSPDADFWNNKGISVESLGRVEEAIGYYQKAIDMDPGHVHAWTNKGSALRNQGYPDRALDCLDRALALDADFAYARHARGNVLTSMARYREAMDDYRRALAADPDFYASWGGLGHVLSLLGRHEQAIACFDEVLRRDRAEVEALVGQAHALERLDRRRDALSCLETALRVDCSDPEIWNNKGAILHELGEYEEALVCYQEATRLDGGFMMAWENMARTLVTLERSAQAILCCEEVLRRDPQQNWALFFKAACAERVGRRLEAIDSYRRFLVSAPDGPQREMAQRRLIALFHS